MIAIATTAKDALSAPSSERYMDEPMHFSLRLGWLAGRAKNFRCSSFLRLRRWRGHVLTILDFRIPLANLLTLKMTIIARVTYNLAWPWTPRGGKAAQ